MASPRISVVIVGRNDTYGTNFIERMNIFIRSLDYHTIRHPDLLELVIVNWNPLPDRAQLQEVIEIAKNFTIRIITVPHDVHVTVPDVTAPVLEFWGKNVGIRRSVGEYVLVSNPDILFTQEMVDFLATETFNEKTVYRTDRYDYHGDGITDCDVSEYIDFAVKNTFQYHGNPETLPVTNPATLETLPKSLPESALFTNASGDFILTSRKNLFKSYGLCFENSVSHGHVDSFSLMRMVVAGELTHQATLTSPLCIFHMDHPRKPNTIPWRPEIARAAANWQGWFAKPTWFDQNWGLANYQLEEWASK